MFESMATASVNKVVATIGGKNNFPKGIGTVKWSWLDELGEVHTHQIEQVHYFPSSPVNILGITTFGRQLNDEDTTALFQSTTSDQVARLFKLASETGIDGIVCSPLELDLAANILSPEMLKITPGIRDISVSDDQSRTMTANKAIKHGASYLVIGRPISKASNVAEALKYFDQSINE